jgi:D-aminoacyl-tRNA deacylase
MTNHPRTSMKLVIQRVHEAAVHVNNALISSIPGGLLVLVGIHRHDTDTDLDELARKLASIRLFSHADQRWSHSLKDAQELQLLLVSQFTLYGDCAKGSKVDFHNAMGGEAAVVLFERFVGRMREELGEGRVKTGAFGQYMRVSLVNDGPVTILLESKAFLSNKQ